jgi:hypothetical protein
MTGNATDSFVHMDAVVEIDEIGKIVHPGPIDGSVLPETAADGLEHGTVGPDLRMAIHARLRRGNPRK